MRARAGEGAWLEASRAGAPAGRARGCVAPAAARPEGCGSILLRVLNTVAYAIDVRPLHSTSPPDVLAVAYPLTVRIIQ